MNANANANATDRTELRTCAVCRDPLGARVGDYCSTACVLADDTDPCETCGGAMGDRTGDYCSTACALGTGVGN